MAADLQRRSALFAAVFLLAQVSAGRLFAFEYTGSLGAARSNHTGTLLPDGKVLVAGGFGANGAINILASAELYDPSTGNWTATGSLHTARYSHTATLLPGGKVLVVAGDPSGKSAELYDPSTGKWTATGSLNTARLNHTATLLPNGKVLVVGSADSNGAVASTELYDPSTGNWTATGNLNTARYSQTATLLPNGKVLVAGGFGTGGAVASAELYDSASGNWTTTGNLGAVRANHTATLLANGKVLVAGGFNGAPAGSAELYDPASGTWAATGSLNPARYAHTATLLPNGRVLVAGGFDNSAPLAGAHLYDPAGGAWAATGNLNTARYNHTATLLTNGKVLAAGGYSASNVVASAELSDARAYSSVAVSSTLNPSEKGENVTFTASVSVSVGTSTGTIQFKDNGADLGSPQTLDAMSSAGYSTSSLAIGTHTITAEYSGDAGGSSSTGTLTGGQVVYPASTLANIATRLEVGLSENVLIAGFVIEGTAPKKVLIRATGPSLTQFGVRNALANPQLELHDNTAPIGLNDDWQTTQVGGVIAADQTQEIQNSGLAPTEAAESAIIATLAPGSYTAIVRGVGGTTGVGLAEVYDLGERGSSARLVNISSRGLVKPNDDVMIGGIIIVKQPTKLVVRALGPSLRNVGISGALADPQLELHDATSTIARNDDWQTTQIGGVITSDQTSELLNSHLAPDDPTESAIIVTLQPGSYTAVVKGASATSGVGLVEVYALP
jgi:hypothetical protein